jgi:hypothetical protein
MVSEFENYHTLLSIITMYTDKNPVWFGRGEELSGVTLTQPLKGQSHEIFDPRFFSVKLYPWVP